MRSMKDIARRAVINMPLPLSRYLLLLQEHRRLPSLRHPQTFNEKVNYRILYDRRPILVTASSKVESKILVRELDSEVLIPRTLWHGSRLSEASDIAVAVPWIIKASHRAGLAVTGLPGRFDEVVEFADEARWLKEYEYAEHRLWAYRHVTREFILEERIGGLENYPRDYKFFVFDGKIGLIQVDEGRHGFHTRSLYDSEWTRLPFTYTHPSGGDIRKPENFDAMVRIAERIGAAFDFIRVDLYNVNGQVYFGELTVYPAGGLSHWPRELDYKVGSLWKTPPRGSLRG